VIVTLVVDDGELAVIVNVLLVAPAATVTLPGTEAALELDERVTSAPPLGAGPESLTVPVAVRPLMIVVADDVTDESFVGVTVSLADFVTPP
jgi:hypothetical protein